MCVVTVRSMISIMRQDGSPSYVNILAAKERAAMSATDNPTPETNRLSYMFHGLTLSHMDYQNRDGEARVLVTVYENSEMAGMIRLTPERWENLRDRIDTYHPSGWLYIEEV